MMFDRVYIRYNILQARGDKQCGNGYPEGHSTTSKIQFVLELYFCGS